MPTPTDDFKLTAFLAACCLFLSTVEFAIPKPIPFMRIGLANIPVLLALSTLPTRRLLLLILLKVLGQATIQGSIFSYVFLFSLAGSLSSGILMMLCSRLLGKRISLIGISVMGALASNLTQILIAVLLLFGESGWLIAPPLLAIGLISSSLLGVFAEEFRARSRWFKDLRPPAKTQGLSA